jgi:cobalt-zinc-cadmium efflux system outer membrane protein
MKQNILNLHSFAAVLAVAAVASARGEGVAATAVHPPTATNQMTLDELVKEAVGNNPELRFYEAEIQAAKAGRTAAGLPANPELSAGLGQKTVRGSGLSGEGVAWSVSILQPFEWPGRLALRKVIANREIELAELGYARFKAALAARMRQLAYGLFAAEEKAAASREVAGRFKALREVLVQRDPAGLTPLLETRVIEATELSMERRASEAELAAKAARLELNQLRGAAPDTPMSVTRTQLAFRPADALQRLVEAARTNNFELRVRAVELAQQGFRVALARNERFPSISVGPTVSEENAFDRERMIGVGVSVPLPLWNRNTAAIEGAVARRMQAETSFAVTQREVERKVIEAALSYETKFGEMAKWRPDSARQFKDAAELADRHYRLGAVPVSTYVELQKQNLEATEALLDTEKEALEAAQNLELLTGLPPLLSDTKEKRE